MKFRTLTLSVLLSMLPLCGLLQAQITGVTAGTDLTGGGTQGNDTLNLDTTKVPRLATANTFTANQTVKGNVNVTETVAGSGFKIGPYLFDSGSYVKQNAFLGFAGNSSTTGTGNTATGYGLSGAEALSTPSKILKCFPVFSLIGVVAPIPSGRSDGGAKSRASKSRVC